MPCSGSDGAGTAGWEIPFVLGGTETGRFVFMPRRMTHPYPARSLHKAKGYWIFAGDPACTDAKVLPVKRQYTATTNIT